MLLEIVKRPCSPATPAKRLSRPDRSWLPTAGERRIVEATLVEAFECDGPPFYRLSPAR